VFLPAFVSSWFNHCQQSAAIIRVNSCAFVAKSNCKRSAAIFPFVFLHAFVSSWFNHCQQSAAIIRVNSCAFVAKSNCINLFFSFPSFTLSPI
jgi:hypothetical protein